MTEQELREKIADRIREGGNLSALDIAWFILELIKRAGYVKLADDQSLPLPESISFELNPEFCGDTLMVSPMGIALKDNLLNAYEQAQQDMLKPDSEGKVWVKVIPKRK